MKTVPASPFSKFYEVYKVPMLMGRGGGACLNRANSQNKQYELLGLDLCRITPFWAQWQFLQNIQYFQFRLFIISHKFTKFQKNPKSGF